MSAVRFGVACVAAISCLSACASPSQTVESVASAPPVVVSSEGQLPTETPAPASSPTPESISTPTPTPTEAPVPVETVPSAPETAPAIEAPSHNGAGLEPEAYGYTHDEFVHWTDGQPRPDLQYILDGVNQRAGRIVLDQFYLPFESLRAQGYWAVATYGQSCMIAFWSEDQHPNMTTVSVYERYADGKGPAIEHGYTEEDLAVLLMAYPVCMEKAAATSI